MRAARTGLLAMLTLLTACTQPLSIMPTTVTVTPRFVLPIQGIVYQRDRQNRALVPIDIAVDGADGAAVSVSFVPVQGGTAVGPLNVGNLANGHVKGAVSLTGGDYRISVSVSGAATGSASMERVGVGDVFVIGGHSVAQGVGDARYDNPDPRVRVVDYYDENCVEASLPTVFSPLTASSKIGPFGPGPYAWGPFANRIVARTNVPVLLFSTAFGGSNILQNYDVIKGIPFDHSFIKYSLGMPFQPLRATLHKYIPMTGVAAVLIHHGVNDRNSNPADFREQYKTVLSYVRQEYALPNVPILLALEDAGVALESLVNPIREATKQVIQAIPNTYLGADLMALRQQRAYRQDTIHLTQDDWNDYATLWSSAYLSIIDQTSPKQAVLSGDYTGNTINGGGATVVVAQALSTVKGYLPTSGVTAWAVLAGLVAGLVAIRKLIPALLLLALLAYLLGNRIGQVKQALKQVPTT